MESCRRFLLFLLLAVLATGSLAAQNVDGEYDVSVNGKKKNLVGRLVDYLDRIELSGLDTNYIGTPKRKWAVFTNLYLSDMDFNLRSNVMKDQGAGYGQKVGRVSIDMYAKMEEQISLGLYYMGYGLSYSFDVGKGYKKDLSFTLYSSPVGGELRFHSTNMIYGTVDIKGMGTSFKIGEGEAKMENFILNAYYVFNKKKFSYGAAMGYSKIQKKSAGSFLAGLTLNQTRISSYDILITGLMGGVNRIHLKQISFGAGYGYNWVPAKGLTLHISEIPMLLVTAKSATKESGEWSDSQKEQQKKLFGSKTHVSFTHMFRTSISYGWKDRFLVGASAYYNYFNVGKHSSYYASIEDWNARFFFAVRF